MRSMLSTLIKKALSLRYSITVRGLEQIDTTRGVLVLPNHPAEIDPIIVSTYLWDTLRPRPVVIESMYNLPFLKPLMKRIDAIPMADMNYEAGPYKRRRIQRTVEDIIEILKDGENVLMYPSGRLSITGEESLGGNSGLATILKSHPQVNIALIRIRGLYGSIFSKAFTGNVTPDVVSTSKQGLRILAENLFFFAPRRKVEVEILFNPSDLPRYADALTLNRYLENFYNDPEPESASLVPHSRWTGRCPSLPEKPAEQSTQDEIPADIQTRVLKHIAHAASVPVDSISSKTRLGDDLGLDSLTIAELLLWVDREFEVHDVEMSEIVSVESVLKAAAGMLGSTAPGAEFIPPAIWTEGLEQRPAPDLRGATSVHEAFLTACTLFSNKPALGDARVGVMSYNDVKLRVVTIARHISKLPGSHIGLLFPASCIGSIAVMATILAGKIPVLLNWTAGKRALLHACDSTNIESILTSRAFLDIVATDLQFLEEKLLLIEDIREQLSLKDKLACKRLASESTPQILDAFGQRKINSNSTCVVLFTSGSEALPKGVPLTHRNILSNVAGILEAFPLKKTDVLLGFLPPFHSFGLTVCTLLPMLTGLRVAYYPNPNESRKIAKAIKLWGATIAAGTPTFLRSILRAGKPENFTSLRALVSGAERAPQDLFDLIKTLPHPINLLEGYGITECSPVVCMNRPGQPNIGVGKPLSGVSVAIVHPETLLEVTAGEQGLILVQGPSIFPGYLESQLTPFINYRKSEWYNTGDLGRFENGSLIITGRLKRFIKIAGEMVSLGAVEEALQKHIPSVEGAPSLAILARGSEGDSRPSLVLFVESEISVEKANEILKQEGFPPLIHISTAKKLRSIPVLGSGKTDYQSLKALLAVP